MTKEVRFSSSYKKAFKKASPFLDKDTALCLEPGETVLAGISGGPDSLALLHFLVHHPFRLRVFPCMVDYGFEEEARMACSVCESLGLTLIRVKTERPQNCYLCSRERKKALFGKASDLGARILFMGHHGDDLLESFFISLLYGGEIHTFQPVERFHGSFFLARPFCGLFKYEVAAYNQKFHLPSLQKPSCPLAGSGKRTEARQLLQAFSRGEKRRILTTLLKASPSGKSPFLL
ncbi:MAG TPA: ATP-binding protein [Candidatus Mcinerneyibacteriales bacterium]|nr:ATP-binding protein [Candidatus Mcinerneyibacteriales bacterium]